MRISRVFQNIPLALGVSMELDEAASHHLHRVLRLMPGSLIKVFNGDGYDYEGEITEIRRKRVVVTLKARYPGISESSCHIHFAPAIVKKDKMAWMLQKAVELGVKTITPLVTAYSQFKKETRESALYDYWWHIVVNACEQCGRATVPLLNAPLSLSQLLEEENHPRRFCIFLNPEASQDFRALEGQVKENRDQEILLLIGPEGGFSEDEIKLSTQHHVNSFSLGSRILRSETAALSALTLLQYFGGDLKDVSPSSNMGLT